MLEGRGTLAKDETEGDVVDAEGEMAVTEAEAS
jgi:hypothetical protein